MNNYDVIIVGAGVIGSAIARELSRFQLKIAVLEKNSDVCFETSGRNSGVVHAGFAYETSSLKNKLCLQGNLEFEKNAQELGVPFKRCGKLLVGNTKEDLEQLKVTMEQGRQNGVSGMHLLNYEELHHYVPTVKGNFGIFSENSGIVDPFLYNIALAENAVENGVEFLFEQEVIAIKKEKSYFFIKTQTDIFQSKWLINSAGLNCGRISSMLGLDQYKIIGSKGNYIVLNKEVGNHLPMPVYPVPSNIYMGIHVTNTIDGNVLVGPDAENVSIDEDYSVADKNIKLLAEEANRLWPHVKKKYYIRNYAGILPKWIDDQGIIQDFKISIHEIENFINLIGIESPGLTAAIPIARYVVELISDFEDLKKTPYFNPYRKPINRFSSMSFEKKQQLITKNPDYGEIICRCEKVSKAEILQAIHNPLNATSLLSIKYRTRAMMGPCQSGYCQMRITELIEKEKNISLKDIQYRNKGSYIFTGKVRT